MLVGTYKHSADSKNRIFIPVKFRADLGGKCVLSKDIMYKCLNLYSVTKWAEFTEKIESLPTIKLRAVRQMIYPNSDETEPDSQGRIILNQRLCADIGLANAKEVMITGANTHAQIWSVEEWEKFSAEMNAPENKEAVIAELLNMGF
jgi:MraZ protein